MNEQNELRCRKILMNNGRGIPALGFGTLIPGPRDTLRATRTALEIGFSQFDCAERYRNEERWEKRYKTCCEKERCDAKISSLLQSSGTTITGQNVSNLRSRLALEIFGSITLTST